MKKKDFIEKCNEARKLQTDLETSIDEIFDGFLSEIHDTPTNAKFADNLGEAITNYIYYGENNLEDL